MSRWSVLIYLGFALTLGGCRGGGSNAAHTGSASRFRAGQVWSYKTRPQEPNSTLTILKVDADTPKGTIVHIHLDGLKYKLSTAPNGVTDTIKEAPFEEDALEKSVVKLVREKTDPLPAYQEEYAEWKKQFDAGQAGAYSEPIAETLDKMQDAMSAMDHR